MERGRQASEAFKRAPDASWISRIRTPPFPMIEPMRIWGMRSRRGYVLDWAVEGASRGSLLRVRIIRPKAYTVSTHNLQTAEGDIPLQQHPGGR